MEQLRTESEGEPALTRVVVIDDHPWVRRGLIALISTEKHFEVCGQAEDAVGAIAVVEECNPDLAIVDISIKGPIDGLELTKRLKSSHPGLVVLILSLHAASEYGARAYAAGASAYLCKSEVNDSLFETLRRITNPKPIPSNCV